jgi:hypothetical protein
MRTQTILAFVLFLAVRAASQDAPKLPAQAQCKFSDGTKISVSYSYERKSYLFSQLTEVSSQSEAFVCLPVITPFCLQRTKTTTGR